MENMRNQRLKYLLGDGAFPEKILFTLELEAEKILVDEKQLQVEKLSDNEKLKTLNKGTEILKKVLILSKVYSIKESKYYKDEKILSLIVSSLESFYTNLYNEKAVEDGNWWHWELGYPLQLLDILIILKEELQKDDIERYINVTRKFQPDPRYSGNNPVAIHPKKIPFRVSTGGNRVDTVKVSLIRGILLEDVKEIELALKSIDIVWKYKEYFSNINGEERDGFYRDGSFIQHGSIAYTGTYGNVLLRGVGEIFHIISGSEFKKYVKDKDEIYKRIFDSFLPLLYKGGISDCVNGRSITRKDSYDHVIGHEIINSIIFLAIDAKENIKKELENMILRELKLDESYNHLDNEKNPLFYYYIDKLLKSNNSKYTEYEDKFYCFNNMNRYFYKTSKYAIGLALHSNRIGNYESMNNENQEGWFTGDGAYYLYNEDLTAYKNYWNRIDMHYIPGTTEIKESMYGVDAQKNYETQHIKEKWAAGVSKNNLGVVGMEFVNYNCKLTSKKSWFFLPGGLIFVETNILGQGEIYTTLENRKLLENELIFIDGKLLKIDSLKGDFKEIKIGNRILKIETEILIDLAIITLENEKFIRIIAVHDKNKKEKAIVWSLILENKIFSESIENIDILFNSDIHMIKMINLYSIITGQEKI